MEILAFLQLLTFYLIILGFLGYGGFKLYQKLKGGIKKNEESFFKPGTTNRDPIREQVKRAGYEDYRKGNKFSSD
jgi:hypothetical protein